MFEDSNKLKQIKSGRRFCMVIRLNSNAPTFLESMFGSERYTARIKSILENKEIVLICVVQAGSIRNLLKKRMDATALKNCFYHWQVDFLLPCLNAKYGKEKADSLSARIAEQKQRGLWGNTAPADFYKLIQQFIQQETLEEEVAKREAYDGNCTAAEFLNRINPLRVEELFSDDAIDRAVLYIAAFFPNLTPPDFDILVRVLLEGKSITLYKTTAVVKGKKQKKKPLAEEKALLDIWQDDADAVLARCRLKSIQEKGGGRIIEFTNPYLREALKSYLEENYSLYIHTQFTAIRDAGILFRLNASPNVIDNLITVSAQMALTDANYYGRGGLVDIVIRLQNESDISQYEVILRLSKLIREMLSYAELKEVIPEFLDKLLDKLMEIREFDLVLKIVLGVTKRLRYTLEFEALHWIRRLLDQAGQKSYHNTNRVLLDLAIQSGFRIYDFLDDLSDWLPGDEREVAKYPRSAFDLLRLIMAYCGYTLLDVGDDEWGVWPSNHPLFATLKDDEASGEKLKLIVSALFDPALDYTLNKDLQDVPELSQLGLNIDVVFLAANFIEAWFLVLCGTRERKREPHPDALAVARLLLRQVDAVLDRKQRRKLMKYWKFKLGLYRANPGGIAELGLPKEAMKPFSRSLSRLKTEFGAIIKAEAGPEPD